MCGNSGKKNTSFSAAIEIYIDNKVQLQKQKFKSHYFSECHQKTEHQNPISKKTNKNPSRKLSTITPF